MVKTRAAKVEQPDFCLYCNKTAHSIGLCSSHLARWRRRQPLEPASQACPVCKFDFTPWRIGQKYCNTDCRRASHGKYKYDLRKSKGSCAQCQTPLVAGKAYCKRCNRLKNLRGKYNLSLLDYSKLFDKQKGLCALCNKPESRKDGRLMSVDHDHKSGKIRGLLCNGCNARLGWYENHAMIIASYLAK